MPAAPASSQELSARLCSGRVAAAIARGCLNKDTTECTVEYALGLLQKHHTDLPAAELDKAKKFAERVLAEVVGKKEDAGALEKWAAEVENKDKVFEDEEPSATNDAVDSAEVASKEKLQAAVKELGMGPAAYRGLPKDDNTAYCVELQKRLLSYITKATGETYTSLPSTEELQELKKTVEASRELSGLDTSNIIEGRPKRRAASNAAAAIKKDVERDLEREAAQAASEPQVKKAKTSSEEASTAAEANSNSKDCSKKDAEAEDELSDEEDDEEVGGDGSDEDSDDSSGSDSDDDDDDEEEEEDEKDEE